MPEQPIRFLRTHGDGFGTAMPRLGFLSDFSLEKVVKRGTEFGSIRIHTPDPSMKIIGRSSGPEVREARWLVSTNRSNWHHQKAVPGFPGGTARC